MFFREEIALLYRFRLLKFVLLDSLLVNKVKLARIFMAAYDDCICFSYSETEIPKDPPYSNWGLGYMQRQMRPFLYGLILQKRENEIMLSNRSATLIFC